MRDILQTIPKGGRVELDVEIEAKQPGLCERIVTFYSDAGGLVESPVLFRAIGK